MRALLRLAYDGTDFAGCAPLPGERTVVGVVSDALARIGQSPTLAEALSRTDAGVHARDNLAHVVLPREMPPRDLLRALDRHLPADARCLGVAPIEALPSPGLKTYAYRLDRTPHGDPFQARWSWRLLGPLDEAVLHELADATQGTHDLEAFRRTGETRDDLVRTFDAVSWRAEPGALVCTITGRGFPYRLVRALVGGMVAVARGSHTPEAYRAALAGDASDGVCRHTAPARGLTLLRHAVEGVDFVG